MDNVRYMKGLAMNGKKRTCGECKWIHMCRKPASHKACEGHFKEKENEVKKDD